MHKTILLSALAAASLLAGCRTTQTNHARRGLLAGSETGRRPRIARPAAAAKPVAAPPPATPALVVERPLVPEPQEPAPQAPVVRDMQSGRIVPPVHDVPMWATPAATPEPAPPRSAAPAAPAATVLQSYTVKAGDVAGRIANSHGMTLKEFLDANGMTMDQAGKLRVGQTVQVWSGAAPLAAGPAVPSGALSTDPDVYVVQPGDTLLGISAKTDVPVATLMANNGIDNPNAIRVGKALRLKAKTGGTVTPPTVQPPRVVPTTVQPPRIVPTTTQPPRVVPTTTQPPRIVPTTTQPPQDASVPHEQVMIAGTEASLQDILNGGSLAEAREQAADKAEQAEKAVREAVKTAADSATDAPPPGYRYYTVKEGDNIYKLLPRFKVPITTLREINNLPPNASKLPAGMRLLVPDSATPAP